MSDEKSKPLILIVDDEPLNLQVLVEALKNEYEVAVVTTGRQALKQLKDHLSPKLILLDVNLPDIDGFEVFSRLSADEVLQNIPVIFITAQTDSDSETKALNLGAVDYIRKPFNRSVVLSRIRSHISTHGMMSRLIERVDSLSDSLATVILKYEKRNETLDPDLMLDALLNTSVEAITVCDSEGRLILVNRAFERITGYRAMDVLYKLPSDIGRQEYDPNNWTLLEGGYHWRGEIVNQRADGTTYDELRAISLVTSQATERNYYVSVFTDISATKKNEQTINFLTWFDGLTGLPNRLQFLDRIDLAMRSCTRSDLTSAVIVADITGFKQLNDSLGLLAGDKVLCALAVAFNKMTSKFEAIARLDGDEFAFLLPTLALNNTAMAQHALGLVESIRATVDKPLKIDDVDIKLECKFGVAVMPTKAQSNPFDVLSHAEIAHHRAKSRSEDYVLFYDDAMSESATQAFRLGQALRKAIENNCFEVHIQSQFQQGKIVAGEALVRWPHEGNYISPGRFIPVAEDHGLDVDIDRIVINKVIDALASQHIRVPISVNVSVNHFVRYDFVDFISKALISKGVPGCMLKIEITENVMIRDEATVIANMDELQSMGLKIALDDFGSGFSSLSYLQKLPINELKIDKAFTDQLNNKHGRGVVELILVMADRLGLEVVVEGVETQEQLSFFDRTPEVMIQGFLLGRPTALAQWISEIA